jgi:molybdopterin-containing oxidoreductase family iron-sulfur binding subunit
MSNETTTDLPRHAEHQDGAETKIRRTDEGGVQVSFSDGSDDLEMSRREFMRVSGVAAASAAMAGANCRYPKEEVVPYLDRPDEVQQGTPNEYASVCNGCSAQCGVLVKTRAGRPISVKGNPDHPINEGSICARGASSYRRLYDPDRARNPLKPAPDAEPTDVAWETLDKDVKAKISEAASSGTIRLLSDNQRGSARSALLDEIESASNDFGAVSWEPLNDSALAEASELSFGRRHIPRYRFDRAQMIVSLGSDFLGTWLSPTEFTKQFSSTRRPEEGEMSRFVAFEGSMTVTGSNADERHRIRPRDLASLAMALAHEVIVTHQAGPLAGNSAVESALQNFTPEQVAQTTGLDAELIADYGQELTQHTGESLIVAGSHSSSTENGVALETAVHLLNAALDNNGETVDHARPSMQAGGSFADLAELVDEMQNGEVDILIVDDANPVYAAPSDLDVVGAIENVDLVISTGDRIDETGQYADYLASSTHWMESWGDAEPYPGTYSIQQPTIQPLYDTRPTEESLLTWFSDVVPRFQGFLEAPDEPVDPQHGQNTPWNAGAWYRYLRDHWKSTLHADAELVVDFETFWKDALRTGVWESETASDAPSFDASGAVDALPAEPQDYSRGDAKDLSDKSLTLFATVGLHDGRWANQGHLQEMPDPVTKTTWDSYVMVSPKTYHQAGLEQGDLLEVTVGDTTQSHPVIMQPGLHDDVVAIPVGYGRSEAGVVGNDVGENSFALSTSSETHQLLSGLDASLSETGDNRELPVVQGAQVIDMEQRPLIATTTFDQYQEDPGSGNLTFSPTDGLWEDHDYDDLKWGMSVDLTKCTGCSACVTACQEENNVPVVGRTGILEGREMHWMRIDRYYRLPLSDENPEMHEQRADLVDDPMYGDRPVEDFSEQYPEAFNDPMVVQQPMMCQHCENAPCETVCPVAATTHSSDGLNQMTYNRCVGTRYCSNNCPFKVRRFNWFNYSRDRSDSVFAKITPELEEHGRMNAEEPLSMGRNPDVTVRSRGVMEKCTFCVQRIRRAKWQRTEEGRADEPWRGDDVKTACEEACPADAITFGSIHDGSNHQVRRDHESPRAVSPLNFLNLRSSVAYLSDIRNTDKGAAAATKDQDGHGAETGAHEGSGH